MHKTGGYLTIYLSLSLAILLTLILTLIDGSRVSAERMRSEVVTDISLNSAFSEYNRELLKQYDLLLIDTGYGMEDADQANTEEHIRQYLEKNYEVPAQFRLPGMLDTGGKNEASCSVSECGYASDDDCAVFKHQIADYMKNSPTGWITEKLEPDAASISGAGITDRDVESERDENNSQIDGMVKNAEVKDDDGNEQEVVLDNPADAAGTAHGIGVLSLAAPHDKAISECVVNPECYISHRERNKGSGICEEEQESSAECGRILLEEYLFRKMGYYNHDKDGSVLKYQLEYILCGKGSDWDNLEGTAERILIWREAANAAYIFTDSEKIAEAEAMAAALSAVTLLPELLEPVKISILFAWSFLESMQDMKVLLDGGREPVIKTASSWQTDLEDIVNVSGSLKDGSGGEGLKYEEYLAVMLLFENENDVLLRAMDIIEMDVRHTPGNMYLRMDRCLDNLTADVCISSSFGHEYMIRRRYGYY